MEEDKLKSRKFVVWITWLIITIAIVVLCGIVMVVTKQILESMTDLIEKSLAYFFAISMMYLGVNVGQKIGFAVSDALLKPTDNKDTEKPQTEN